MKKLILSLGLLIMACKNPTENISNKVEILIIDEFKNKGNNYKLINVSLVHFEGNQYKGIVYYRYKDYPEIEQRKLSVVYDGENIMYGF